MRDYGKKRLDFALAKDLYYQFLIWDTARHIMKNVKTENNVFYTINSLKEADNHMIFLTISEKFPQESGVNANRLLTIQKKQIMNYTTIEQSKKLIELGLDPDTADMWYEQIAEDLGGPVQWKAFVGKNSAIQYNLFSYRKGYIIPCWSLGALIELMPLELAKHSFILCRNNDGTYFSSLTNKKDESIFYTDNLNLTETLVKIILWLLENNYIKKEFLNTKNARNFRSF